MRDQPHMMGDATLRTTRYPGVCVDLLDRREATAGIIAHVAVNSDSTRSVRQGRHVRDELTDGASASFRPSGAEIRSARAALAPWRALAAPRFYGIENVPEAGAVLLVGNHSI